MDEIQRKLDADVNMAFLGDECSMGLEFEHAAGAPFTAWKQAESDTAVCDIADETDAVTGDSLGWVCEVHSERISDRCFGRQTRYPLLGIEWAQSTYDEDECEIASYADQAEMACVNHRVLIQAPAGIDL